MKMHKNARLASLLMAMALAVTAMLSACTSAPPSSSSKQAGTPSSKSQESGASSEDAPEVPEVSTEGLEFTFLGKTRPPYEVDQMDIWNELMKRTGATINFNWAPNAEFDQKVNTVLASGNLPDVIFEANIATLMKEKAIIPIDDLLNNYGDNITRYLNDNDYLSLRQVADSKVYHIPHLLDFPPSLSMMVREDWVKQLGLEMPETWEEWKVVWQGFKDNDMNGDGDNTNEIPLLVCEADGLLKMANMYGIKVSNRFFARTNDDKEVVGLFGHPDFRAYITELQEMYAAGIIDPEFVTREYKPVLDGGFAGSCQWFAERTRLTTDILRETDPEAALIGVPAVKAPNGSQLMRARVKTPSTGLVFTVQAEKSGKAEQIMAFYNYVYSDEGNVLMNYGIEGQHHDIVDGKPKIKEEITKGSFNEARKVGIIPSITPFNFMEDSYLQILLQSQPVEALPESSKYFYDALFLNEPYFYSEIPIFTTDSYVKHQATMDSKLMEIYVSCVSGRLSVDDFYAAYQKLLDEGWADVISEQNEAYQRLMNG